MAAQQRYTRLRNIILATTLCFAILPMLVVGVVIPIQFTGLYNEKTVREVVDDGEVSDRGELGLGDAADADLMQRAVGLVWRATVLWILLLFLLGLASLAG